jgi:O-antigen ligase
MQIGLAVAAAGIALALFEGFRPSRTPLDLPLLCFVGAAVLSDALSRYGAPSLANATLWRSVLGFWVVAQGLALLPDPTEKALRLLALAGAGLCASSLVGLVQYRTGIDVVHWLGLRASPHLVEAPGVPGRYGAMGFFISRLSFGHNASVLAALLGGTLAAGGIPSRARPWALLGLLVALAAVVVTFDRAAWLALLCAAAVALAAVASRTAARGRLAVVASALVVLVALLSLHPGVRGRFESAFEWRRNADRVFLWARAAEIVRDHPLLGVGFGNYPRICGAYYDRIDPSFPMRTWAHNTELSLLAETGPLGAFALVWVFAAAVAALFRRRDALAVGALCAIVALAVIAQVHDVLYDTKVMYALWFSLGLALAPAREPAVRLPFV